MGIIVRIASETSLLRQGVHSYLEKHPEIKSVESVACIQHCAKRCFNPRANVLIIDVSKGKTGNIDCIRQLTVRYPETRIIALINRESIPLIPDIFDYGARAVVSLNADPTVLTVAVKKVASGETFMEPELAQALTEMSFQNNNNPFDKLSKREKVVLMLILNGHSNDSCATVLNVSKKTIANQYSHIKSKLGIDNRVQLTRLAVLHQLIRVD